MPSQWNACLLTDSQNRGMVLSAPSYSHTEYYPTPTFEHALELPSDRHLNAYDKLDPTHFAHASSGIKKIQVPFGMTTKEAAGMFEIWSRKGIVRRCECNLSQLSYLLVWSCEFPLTGC